jgi:hypothetical protein
MTKRGRFSKSTDSGNLRFTRGKRQLQQAPVTTSERKKDPIMRGHTTPPTSIRCAKKTVLARLTRFTSAPEAA